MEPPSANNEAIKDQEVGACDIEESEVEQVMQLSQNGEREEFIDMFPNAQLKRKRDTRSPSVKKIEKGGRMEPRSDSSSSMDLNRIFPSNSANEISFLSIELKSSTPRAAKGSSGKKQVQPPGFSVIEMKEELVSQEIVAL